MSSATIVPDPGNLRLICMYADRDQVIVSGCTTAPEARCPLCRRPSSRTHSRYMRTVSDLPWQGMPVKLRIRIRRFFCDNPSCDRAIFTEHLPTVVSPYARRTNRLNSWLTQVAFALGGEPGARLLRGLGVMLSGDTLLNHIRSLELRSWPTPRVLSVDDFALRKGRTYGTALVDIERHVMVDILPDRSAEVLTRWLSEHSGVEVIARDRGGVRAGRDVWSTGCCAGGGQVPSDQESQRRRLEGIQAAWKDDRASAGAGSITADADPPTGGPGAV